MKSKGGEATNGMILICLLNSNVPGLSLVCLYTYIDFVLFFCLDQETHHMSQMFEINVVLQHVTSWQSISQGSRRKGWRCIGPLESIIVVVLCLTKTPMLEINIYDIFSGFLLPKTHPGRIHLLRRVFKNTKGKHSKRQEKCLSQEYPGFIHQTLHPFGHCQAIKAFEKGT